MVMLVNDADLSISEHSIVSLSAMCSNACSHTGFDVFPHCIDVLFSISEVGSCLPEQLRQVQQSFSALEGQVEDFTGSQGPALKERAELAEAEAVKAKKEVEGMQKALEYSTSLVREAQSQVQDLESKLELSRTEAKRAVDLSHQLEECSAQMHQMESELQQEKRKMIAMQEEVSVHKRKVSMARGAVEQLHRERTDATNKTQELANQVNQLMAANAQLQEDLLERDASRDLAQGSTGFLSADMDSWVDRAQNAEKRAQDIQEEMQRHIGEQFLI